MQNRQNGRRRGRGGGGGGGGNPRPMGQQPNANRLEVRVRGNAHQLLDKYKQMARDAHQAGDRVAAEYYLQHADHYFRVLNDGRIRQEEMRARRGIFDPLDEEVEGEDEAMEAAEASDGAEASHGEGESRQEERRDGDGREPRAAREPRQDRGERGERRRFEDRGERGERASRGDRSDRGDRAGRQFRDGERPRRERGEQQVNGTDRTTVSDGEAALVAFGGPINRAPEPQFHLEPEIVPQPDLATTVRQADATVEAPAGTDEAVEVAPAPRRRGRPRKAAAVPEAPVAEA